MSARLLAAAALLAAVPAVAAGPAAAAPRKPCPRPPQQVAAISDYAVVYRTWRAEEATVRACVFSTRKRYRIGLESSRTLYRIARGPRVLAAVEFGGPDYAGSDVLRLDLSSGARTRLPRNGVNLGGDRSISGEAYRLFVTNNGSVAWTYIPDVGDCKSWRIARPPRPPTYWRRLPPSTTP